MEGFVFFKCNSSTDSTGGHSPAMTVGVPEKGSTGGHSPVMTVGVREKGITTLDTADDDDDADADADDNTTFEPIKENGFDSTSRGSPEVPSEFSLSYSGDSPTDICLRFTRDTTAGTPPTSASPTTSNTPRLSRNLDIRKKFTFNFRRTPSPKNSPKMKANMAISKSSSCLTGMAEYNDPQSAFHSVSADQFTGIAEHVDRTSDSDSHKNEVCNDSPDTIQEDNIKSINDSNGMGNMSEYSPHLAQDSDISESEKPSVVAGDGNENSDSIMIESDDGSNVWACDDGDDVDDNDDDDDDKQGDIISSAVCNSVEDIQNDENSEVCGSASVVKSEMVNDESDDKLDELSSYASGSSLDKSLRDLRRASLPAQLSFRYNAATETVKAKEAPAAYSYASNGVESNDESLDSSSIGIGDRSLDISSELSKSDKRLNDKKRKSSYWYNVLSPTYKSKCEDFKKISKGIPNDERLVVDYSCALQKDILVHGRLYITQNWICFYANIFRWETVITIKLKDVTFITKEKTARVIPNAIQICTNTEKLFFTSFGARDKTYLMLFRVWQNALMDQPMSPPELWQWVHYSYGEELGLTSSDDDYIPPLSEDKISDNQVSPVTDSSIVASKLMLNEDLDLSLSKDNSDQLTSINVSYLDCDKDDESRLASGVEELKDDDDEDLVSPTANQLKQQGVEDCDIPTDLSDNTDVSEGEVVCAGHSHLQLTMIDEIFHISVDAMFNFLFTDCAFYRAFCDSRKIFDLTLPGWDEELDGNGDRNRRIIYTLTLNASFGPKVATTTEKQLCYSHSKPGVLYVVDCETINGRIPYGDSFGVLNRYCVTRVNTSKCRLKITSEIIYKKSVWGMVKGIIDKNCQIGLNEHFQELAERLREESDKAAILVGQQSTKKKIRRKRRGHSVTEGNTTSRTPDAAALVGTPTAIKGAITREEWVLRLNAETLVRILGICLLVLILFNGLLYYKLWTLESVSARINQHFNFKLDELGKYPKSREEWMSLLKTQQYLHDVELDRWKDILGSSITLIEQMKVTLVELQRSIARSHTDSAAGTAETES